MLDISIKSASNLKISVTILKLCIPLVIVFFGMRVFDTPLKNEISPKGIVSFELAKDLNVASAILDSWDIAARTSAGMSMGLDFLFIVLYTTVLVLLLLLTKPPTSFFQKVFRIICGLLLFAALCDVVENIALIKLLLGDLKQFWVSLAYYMAIIKFGIILLGIAYLFLQLVVQLLYWKNATIPNIE